MPSRRPRSMTGRNVLHATGVPRAVRNAHLAGLRFIGRLRTRDDGGARAGASGTLRVLACTPTALPDHRRGAEVTLHLVLREFARRGHTARVLLTSPGTPGVVDGIEVVAPVDSRRARQLGDWSDVIIGQLDARAFALRLAARCRRPIVYYMHMGNVARRALFGRPDLTVFASSTARSQYPWITRALIVRPPVPPVEYATTPGNAITLVTPSAAKGVHVFTELARRFPERSFLTVGNADASVPFTANITMMEPVDDMRTVYARTRVLLMPSVYESYPRVGLEAAVSGIPTIAHPAKGIREALGDAAIFVDRDDVDGWARAVRQLDDPGVYEELSERARSRVMSLNTESELRALEEALRALASEGTT